jgi:hypothetical protein
MPRARGIRPPGPAQGGRPPTADITGPGQPNGQPVQVPTGLPYGQAGALAAAQHALPLPQGNPTPPAAAPLAPGGAAGGPAAMQQALMAARQHVANATPLLAPTERPNEPITAGMSTGAGPGPESLNGFGAQGAAHAGVVGLLQSLAAQPGASPHVQALADYAATGHG